MSDQSVNHTKRAEAILALAVRTATKGFSAASTSLIRKRVETSLQTALAMCTEDVSETHKCIEKAREELKNE